VILLAPGDLAIHEGFRDRTHPDPLLVCRVWRVLEGLQGDRRVSAVPLGILAARSGLQREEGVLLICLNRLVREGALRVVGPVGIPDAEGEGEVAGRWGPPLPTLVLQRLVGGTPSLPGLRVARQQDEDRLESVAAYLATRGCRRAFLLRYFGERSEPFCGRCDRCGTRGTWGGASVGAVPPPLQSEPQDG